MSSNNGKLRKHQRRIGALNRFNKSFSKKEPKRSPLAKGEEYHRLFALVEEGNRRFGGSFS